MATLTWISLPLSRNPLPENPPMKRILLSALLALSCLGAHAKTVVIDVRTADEFAAGHLDGALNIDHQVIAQRIGMAGVSKDDEIILYCRSGRRSALATETLKGLGFKHLKDYGSMEDAQKKLQK
jgi:phage shock protein E